MRIWDPTLGLNAGVPSSCRICEDINRIVDETYLSIVAHRGRAMYGPHTCTGRRQRECGATGEGRGGVRVKKDCYGDMGWVHPDVTHLLENYVDKYKN